MSVIIISREDFTIPPPRWIFLYSSITLRLVDFERNEQERGRENKRGEGQIFPLRKIFPLSSFFNLILFFFFRNKVNFVRFHVVPHCQEFNELIFMRYNACVKVMTLVYTTAVKGSKPLLSEEVNNEKF